MPKLLLTSVFQPYGIDDEFNCATAPQQSFLGNIHDEGVFTVEHFEPTYALQFIAHNLSTPTVVLDYPTLEEFEKELENNYDFIGISFIPLAFEKAKLMTKIIRKKSPNSKIIFGNHGASIPEARELADFVCEGEGVKFMWEILGEKNKAISHPIWRKGALEKRFMGINLLKKEAIPKDIVTAFGCEHNCEFCKTSAFFGTKALPVLSSAKKIYAAMEMLGGTDFYIRDENFFSKKELVRELGETLKKDKKTITWRCYGMARDIAEFDPQELVEFGISMLWIGIESSHSPYFKTKGINLKKLFDSLHNVGIETVSSSMFGFDFHTREIILKEIDNVLALKPCLTQFLIYSPVPGTALYEKLKKENRLLSYPWKHTDGHHLLFKHPHLKPKELQELKELARKKSFEVLGPSFFRLIETRFQGYKHFIDSSNERLQHRAQKDGRHAFKALPFFPAAKLFAPNKAVGKKLSLLEKEIQDTFGKPTLKQSFTSILALKNCAVESIKLRLFGRERIQRQPKSMRYFFTYVDSRQENQ